MSSFGIKYNISQGICLLEEKAKSIDKLHRARSVGIYFGLENVSAIHLSKGITGVRVLTNHSFKNPLKNVPETSKDLEEALISELLFFLNKSDKDWDELIIGVPRKYVVFKHLSIPAPSKNLIKNIIEFELERHIPFSVKDAAYDFHVVSHIGDNIYNVLLVVINKNILEYYINLLKGLGLKVSTIDVSCNAAFNMLMSVYPEKNSNTVIVNLDGNYLEISLIRNGDLILPRSIRFNKNLILENKLAVLVSEEITKTTANFSLWLKGKENKASIILIGFSEFGKKFTNEISERTGFNTELIESRIKSNDLNIKVPKNNGLLPNDLLKYVYPLGLAFRGLKNTAIKIHLWPELITSKPRYYSGYLTIILMVLFVVLIPAIGLSPFLKNKIKLAHLEETLKSSREHASAVEKIFLEAELLEKQINSLEKLQQSSFNKLDLLMEITKLSPPDVMIKEINIREDVMEVKGYATQASPLINIYEKSPFFEDVRFSGRIISRKGKDKFKLVANFKSNSENGKLQK